jgi:hypothetical protein
VELRERERLPLPARCHPKHLPSRVGLHGSDLHSSPSRPSSRISARILADLISSITRRFSRSLHDQPAFAVHVHVPRRMVAPSGDEDVASPPDLRTAECDGVGNSLSAVVRRLCRPDARVRALNGRV